MVEFSGVRTYKNDAVKEQRYQRWHSDGQHKVDGRYLTPVEADALGDED